MRHLLPVLVLVVIATVACEQRFPSQPSDTDDDITITTVINIGGDDNSGKNGDGNGDTPDPGPDPNAAPFINPVPSQFNECGDNVSLPLSAIDQDGDNLTWQWEANSAPRNLTLQSTGPQSALISGTISSSSAVDSPFTTRIIASDGRVEASTIFLWEVTCGL